MADGQHSRTDGGVPAAGRETARPIPPAGMAARACPEPVPSEVEGLSRRALLGAVCAAPALSRHPGLDPGSTLLPFSLPPSPEERWIPAQVRHDEDRPVTNWSRALARYRRAEAALEAAKGSADDHLYDRLLGRLLKALARLLRTPAPHLPALAEKLDLLVAHQAWELRLAGPALAAMQRDARRLADGVP